RGGPLRPQGEAAPALVLEGEHLLADDVGRLADAALEEVGVLEDRRRDRLVAGAGEDLGGGAFEAAPGARLLGKDVEGPAGGLGLARHGPPNAPASRGRGCSPAPPRAWSGPCGRDGRPSPPD